ncbi:IS110 family transposase [Candidatus Poriferisodalis sp.]|uniref:IS110 family transposase n=1 Tax=Candidatus Poriferisodalis sp. TaxID=3101277 RepID=UPI003B5B8457
MTDRSVIAGVDTHKHTHHAAVVGTDGRFIAGSGFAATSAGHEQLAAWLTQHGRVVAVGVEGTGSYGASLTRTLEARGIAVVEVNAADRSQRRRRGKSDTLDAEQAARSVLARTSTATPKSKNGDVEAIRVLRIARSTAVKSRTKAMNAIHAIAVTAPDGLRDELINLKKRSLIRRCRELPPPAVQTDIVLASTVTSLRTLAERWTALDNEIDDLDTQLDALVSRAAPDLCALHGVGTEIAAQMLITAGDNHDRLSGEAAFARLCGVAPQPASSGKTTGRHRLSRSGDRAANSAIYLIVITRLRRHEPTRAYLARRTAEGLSKREIIRCLKRYVAREIYHALPKRP